MKYCKLNNFDSEEVKWMADYADWDLEEIKTVLPELFPDAKSIIIDSIEPETLYAKIDGIDYEITPDGEYTKL